MKTNERLLALTILITLLKKKLPLSQLLLQYPTATPFTKELCFGVSRHFFRLQVLTKQLMKKYPPSLEVSLVILLGLYQLHFLQKPDYATVKETVALLDKVKKNWAKGLVNAVLRTFCREREIIIPQLNTKIEFVFGHPQWLLEGIQRDWPQHWQDILQANDEHPPMCLRINRLRTDRTRYLEKLQTVPIAAFPLVYSSVGIQLENACSVNDLPGFSSGEVSVQDESAQLAASLLLLKPGLRVLDACCAPGGKTCHILETEPKLKTCIALDINAQRLERVKENLDRLHLTASLIQGDGLEPSKWWDGQPFDRILLDAPCSATGVIRRHPDIKLLRTEEEIGLAVKLQYSLLTSLWPLLGKNGILVYSTCSLMKEENEHQIAYFIEANSDCAFLDLKPAWGKSTGYGWQIFPTSKGGDGFFYSVLRKIEGPL